MSTAGVAAANRLAAQAGVQLLGVGGNAVDAAVAAAAAMAVTSPHQCGLGGDLFALISDPAGGPPTALNASGRAGSGADAAGLRAEGHEQMPFRDDARAVTVPGCVDGLVALQARFGARPLADVLAPAIALADDGFPVSATLALASRSLPATVRARAFANDGATLRRDDPLRLPRLAALLRAIAAGGRAAFYGGAAGEDLLTLGGGTLFAAEDLRRPLADWTEPLTVTAFGHTLWTTAPNSQGYLTLAGAWLADRVGLPRDPRDPAWVATLVAAAREAARDRVAVLHEHADGAALLDPERLAARARAISAADAAAGAADPGERYDAGDTTYLCAVDGRRRGVSLILSNCAGFGSQLLLESHGVFLHNRGVGFSLQAGHPAEYRPGARPPHTLSPALVTAPDGELRAVLGTMGGDAQPQIVLQLLARTLAGGEGAQAAVDAPRFVLTREPTNGFDTWNAPEPPRVALEPGAPSGWAEDLRARGHVVEPSAAHAGYGHAQLIAVDPAGELDGAADPRALSGAFVAA